MIYEDITVGSRHDFGVYTFTGEDIKRFASLYDPQAFHLDEELARESAMGALCASGWHTAAVMMSLVSRYFQRERDRAAANGRPAPPLGPSPGFDDLKWLRPVFVDDTIAFSGEVLAKRSSESRPSWGIVSIKTTGINQSDEPVFSYVGHVFVALA